MSKRRLKRQLNLAQVVMLGTAGTIGAQIFVLTGYAAGLAGPATILALLVGGLLTYSIALNYCELATAFPVTGGAMTYVREAYGNNILSFLVGSMDCLSSTFYAALSAMGFAYSLQVFFPGLPVVFTAIAVIAVFTVLNVLGVAKVGNTQIILGGLLLLLFAVYIVLGFVRPAGFHVETFLAGGSFFIHPDAVTNLSKILRTIALIYVAYVGFEVIADDAEEVQNPTRTIPLGILISLTLVLILNVSTVLVTLGAVPWPELARSPETALTDAVQRFLPGWGVPMMAIAGIIATLTSINTSMLSATREGFTLSRDGTWPRAMSRLGHFHTPYVSIVVIGVISCFVATVGLVDFMSYISSAGYLFVLFWASLAMIRLRKQYPDLKRPFKVPLFPLTAYVAAATGFLIIAFTEWKALLFGVGVLAVCSVYYYTRRPVGELLASRARNLEKARDRILVPVANPRTAESLVHLATILAQASEDTSVCVLTVVPISPDVPEETQERMLARLEPQRQVLLNRIADEAQKRNVPLYTKLRVASGVADGVLDEVSGNVKLVLMGWPGPLAGEALAHNVVNEVLMTARANFAVLLDRGLKGVRRILVPVGGGVHSRLAIRLAYEIAAREGAHITALHCLCEECEFEELEDRMAFLREIIEDELGSVPSRFTTRLAQAADVAGGILEETARQPYDLVVVGASEEWSVRSRFFGTVDDQITEQIACSVMLVRRYEPAVISWIKRRVKM
jgi:amino acid transporter/nucleotide-binding universal stress UspA family protein